MYRIHGLFSSHSDFSLPEAHSRLATRFPQYRVQLDGSLITIESSDWQFFWKVVSGPDVETENFDQIDVLHGYNAQDFVGYDHRVEIWSELPDTDMAHFADFQDMVEILKSFSNMLVVDPKEPGVM